MAKCDVAVIGAGPYGLSATAHLRAVKGLDVRTFGEPMSFWQRNMPAGMLLRSGWKATHLADPEQSLTLDRYRAASRRNFSTPVPLDCFIDYGLWFQRQVVPDLDRQKILRIESSGRGFGLITETGETVHAGRVVIAAGIGTFTWRPPQFAELPPSLVSHTSEHGDLRSFSGKRVLVIGSGQSALESAALLHESEAEVEILGRAQHIRWLGGLVSRTFQHGLGTTVSKLLYAPTDVGPAGICHVVARPDLTRRFPRAIQDWLRKRSIRPAGAGWLVRRLQDVPMCLGRSVISASDVGNCVRVRLDDGTERICDHVLLGTGYRVDISKYDFLSPELTKTIACFQGYPRLGEGLESSVPGLHFLGAPAIWSFGALMQFVVGAHYASRALMLRVSKRAQLHPVRIGKQLAAENG